jgi:hypothetical protein
MVTSRIGKPPDRNGLAKTAHPVSLHRDVCVRWPAIGQDDQRPQITLRLHGLLLRHCLKRCSPRYSGDHREPQERASSSALRSICFWCDAVANVLHLRVFLRRGQVAQDLCLFCDPLRPAVSAGFDPALPEASRLLGSLQTQKCSVRFRLSVQQGPQALELKTHSYE